MGVGTQAVGNQKTTVQASPTSCKLHDEMKSLGDDIAVIGNVKFRIVSQKPTGPRREMVVDIKGPDGVLHNNVSFTVTQVGRPIDGVQTTEPTAVKICDQIVKITFYGCLHMPDSIEGACTPNLFQVHVVPDF